MHHTIAPPNGVRESQWLRLARRVSNAWHIAERNAAGRAVGTSVRHADGSFTPAESRGLIYAHPLDPNAGATTTDPILVTEGATDTAAMMSLGFDAIGLPHPGACSDWLATLTADRHVVIVSDDPDANGASMLAAKLAIDCRSVRIITPNVAATRADYDASIAAATPEVSGDSSDNSDNPHSDADNAHNSPDKLCPRTIDEGAVSLDSLVADFPTIRPVVIDGLLRQGEVMNVVAAPKVGKSWLVHALAMAVATGRDWLNFPTTRGQVLLIDAELHPETLASRLRSVRQSAGIPTLETPDLRIRAVRGQRVTIDEIAAQAATTPTPYRLIILDAMYRFLTGEENSNEDMTRVYNALDSIARTTGAAIVVVHHTSKGVQSDKAVTDVGSGAGAQSRAADTHLVVRHHEQEGCVVVDGVVRSFPAVDPFVIRFLYPGWQIAPDLDPTALLRPNARKDEESPVSSTERNAAFLATLPAHGRGLTIHQIAKLWSGEPVNDRTLATIAVRGIEAGLWSREGDGTRFDPFRYLTRADAQPPLDCGGLPV